MKIRHLTWIAALLLAAVPARSQDESPGGPEALNPEMAAAGLGDRVLAFCMRNLGVKVGNGQCATLASQALQSAGAIRTARDFPNAGDYVWGRQVALIEAGRKRVAGLESLALVMPGDIIQFRNARLQGAGAGGFGTYWMTADHHTAVVGAVDAGNAVVTVYHQNWGRKIVRLDRMLMADLKKGWLRFYRPQKRGE